MKRLLLTVLAAMMTLGAQSMMAQENNDKEARKAEKQAKKEARKARKEKEKKIENAVMEIAFQQALQALEAKQFVLEAERVEFKRGTSTTVNPVTNFVMVNGEEASIQLSSNAAIAGTNGMGGITVDGHTSDVSMTTNKKGDISYSMTVNGAAVSAIVTFNLIKGSNRCSVTVSPNFNSNRITFTGKLVPLSKSRIHKGSSI